MPKIQVYKSASSNNVIPVDDATVRNAFRCRWTGKIFLTKKSYTKHLREYRYKTIHARVKNKNAQRKLEQFWHLTSFPEIEDWVELNSDFIFDCLSGLIRNKAKIEEYREQFQVKLSYLSVQYFEYVSNTHSCPHNGVTNWGCRDPDKPTGYPGWAGRIEFEIHSHPNTDISGSDVGRLLRLKTGTGGGRGHSTNPNIVIFGYDLKIFRDDWPGLDEMMVLEKLDNGYDNSVYFSGQRQY